MPKSIYKLFCENWSSKSVYIPVLTQVDQEGGYFGLPRGGRVRRSTIVCENLWIWLVQVDRIGLRVRVLRRKRISDDVVGP